MLETLKHIMQHNTQTPKMEFFYSKQYFNFLFMDYPVKKYTKVPLQQTTKTRKTVFAYMRRSTKKDTQANSLFQQGEFIEKIIKNLGID